LHNLCIARPLQYKINLNALPVHCRAPGVDAGDGKAASNAKFADRRKRCPACC
jgi:hypothetical protein